MSPYSIVPLVAALACFAVGALVAAFGRRNRPASAFIFLALTLVAWNLNFVVLYLVRDEDLAFRLTRLCRFVAVLLPPAILHFSLQLSNATRTGKLAWALRFFYLAAFLLAVLNYFDLLISSLRPDRWGFHSVGTPFYHVFSLLFVSGSFLSAAAVIRSYTTTDNPRIRLQLKFWLFGMAVALPLGLTNLLPSYGVPIYPLGNLGSAAFAVIVAYAIARHRLMDIEVVLTKGIALSGVWVIVLAPAFALGLFLQHLAFHQVHYDFSAGLLAILTLVGILFSSLRARLEKRVEQSLFRERYENRIAFADLAKSLITILDQDTLGRELCETLGRLLHIEHSSLYLLRSGTGVLERRMTAGNGFAPPSAIADSSFLAWFRAQEQPVLRDELEERASTRDSPAARLFRASGWEACLPLVGARGSLGLLALGRKTNREPFVVGDIELLVMICAQASIALENARLYDEVRKSRDIIERTGRLSAIGTLAAGIAHEIRNPLVSIQTFFQLAPHRMHDEEFLTSFLKLTEAEVGRINSLIAELLNFARTQAHTFCEVDVDGEVDRALTLVEPQSRREGVSLVRRKDDRSLLIRGDADQLRQVLINLLLNAVQASGKGGTVTTCTRLVTQNDREFCEVEILDSGPGVPNEVKEDIFNPFFTTKEKGTGLGLSIANQIVTEHGGFISVENRSGAGASFAVRMPSIGGKVREPVNSRSADEPAGQHTVRGEVSRCG